MILEFTVWGTPVAQPRIKARAFKNKEGKHIAAVYEPGGKARQFKSDVRLAYEQILTTQFGPLPTGPIRLDARFFFPRPKRLMRKADPEGPILHTSKPDRDNVEKAIMDALNTVAWIDDRQICCGEIQKFYHEKHGRPRTEIRIEEVEVVEG